MLQGRPSSPDETAAAPSLTGAPKSVRAWWQSLARADWLSWRLRGLAVMALIGCIGLFVLLRGLAQSPYIDVTLRANLQLGVDLVAAGDPLLQARLTQSLRAVRADNLPPLEVQSVLLQTAPRWIVDRAERALLITHHERLAVLVEQPVVQLSFADGGLVALKPSARGLKGLGTQFWLLGALSLVLYLIAAVVLFTRPSSRNGLYLLMTWCLALTLLFIAVESLPGLGLPAGFAAANLRLRTILDIAVAAAILNVCVIHPTRVRHGRWLAAAGWVVASVLAAQTIGGSGLSWWWTQCALIGYGLVSLWVLTLAHRGDAHPVALVLRRLGAAMLGTLILLTLGVSMVDRQAQYPYFIASIGSVVWYVFMASLLMLVPFLARSQHLMREFAMLAGLSTIATSLDLLFVSAFAMGQFTSLTLALFVSFGVYAGARQWVLSRLAGSGLMSAEQTFESLYRAARAIETAPDSTTDHVVRLLHDLFEPLEIRVGTGAASASKVSANGSALQVSMQGLPGANRNMPSSFVLRHARRGRRLFTVEDAHLADRVLAQLRSAVTYDLAVEHGRSEERMRLAQDLHDDIGARLLTLMYKAPNAEMEEYARHTLQDLKTLTRGLAAQEHRLCDAAAEWKADIGQRLSASHCELEWTFRSDDANQRLSVVQWSGITRILRELVNNVISHANAGHVDIQASFVRGELHLIISDDGNGRSPQTWSHGLGLGGVRKRAKVLGGQVSWHERHPVGIRCEVHLPKFAQAQT